MFKLFSMYSISSLPQGYAVNRSILAFMSEIARTFKVVNRRALSTMGTTLMLSALLSACGGGGGSGSDAPTPAAPTTPTFSISSNNFSVDEDFATPQLVASVSNATTITVSQSNTGVVTVTTSNAQVNVLSMPNANGRTILTIRAINGAFSATTQVTVTVNAVNDPPTLAVSSNNISTVGGFSPITINTTASDIEDGALAFTVSESTPGVVRVGTPGDAIILSNIPNASGQTTLTVTAVDSSGSTVTQTIAVNVTITTSTSIPALFVSSTLVNEQEDFGAAVVIRTTATDADGDTITFSVSPLRGIVNADISTSVISTNTIVNTITLSAAANTNGTATLTVRATDAGGQSTEVNIVVVVVSVNDTPTLTIPNANLVVAEDFSGNSTIATAIDIDGDTLTFSVVESTTGVVTVSTSASGVSISNRPHANGVTTLTITVRDGSLNSTAQVMVTVTEVNDPPILNIPSATLTRVEDFVGGITVATASDVDGNPLTFSVDQSTTGVIRVTVSTSDVRISSRGDANGITTLSISVNDGTVSSTAQVVVTVTEVNDPPILNIPNATLTRVEDFVGGITVATASDVDGNPLTFSVDQSTTGVIRVTVSTSDVRISSRGDANGITTLSISVSDGRIVSSTEQVVVTVTAVNDPPVLTVTTNVLTLLEDFGAVLIGTNRSDVDSNTLTLTVAESTTGVITVQTSTSGISVSSIDDRSGRTTLTITLSDSELSSTTQVVVDVTAVNDTPTLTISTTALTLNEDFGSVLIATTRSDVDSTTLTLTVAESATGVVTVRTSTSGISVSSIENKNGRTTLTITLSDNELISTTQIVVTVTPINDPPTLAIPSATLTVAEDFVGVITVATASDVDGDTLTLTVAESSTGIVTVTTSASGVQIVSLREVSGQTTLMITVSDSTLSSTTQVVVTITPVNDPPILNIPSATLTRQEDFVGVITVATASDVDGDTLTLTVAESSTGIVTVTTSASGVQIESLRNVSGQTTLMITVSDSTLSSTTQVVVTITPVNDPPILNIPSATLTRQEDFVGVITVATASDVDGDTLTLTVAESSTGIVTVTTSASGVQIEGLRDISGQTTLMITVSDSTLSSTTQVVVTITPVNDPPILNIPSATLTRQEDFVGVITVATASDVDGDTLTITVAESSTGIVTVTTSASGVQIVSLREVSGQTTLMITVSDSTLSSTTQVVVTVNAVNDPPILNIPSATLTRQEDFVGVIMVATASDVDGDTLTITVAESSTGIVTVTTSASGVQIVSLREVSGQTTLMITVSDSTLSSTTQVVVTITPVNDPPILNIPSATLTRQEDFVGVITVATASDVDGDTLTLTVAESSTGIVTVTTSASGVQIESLRNVSGQTTLMITVSDSTLSSTTQVVVTITPVNDPPILNIPSATLTRQEDFVGVITVATASDVDGDTLTLTVAESSTGIVTVTTSASGVQIEGLRDISGQTTLMITVSDSTLSSTTQVVVDVTPVNDPPVLTVSTNALTLLEDFGTILIATTRTDIDSNTLTLTVAESATGVVTVLTSISGISVSSIDDRSGRTTLTISLSDGRLSTATQVVVDVTRVNDPPVLTVSTNALTLLEDFATVLIATTRTDIDSNTLTLTVSESTTGVVSVTATDVGVRVANIANANGRTTLTSTLSDGRLSTTTQVVVTVTPVNDPPVLTVSTNALTLNEDFGAKLIATTRTDIDSNTLTLTVSESATGVVTVLTSTSGISVSSIDDRSGRTTLTITLSDGRLSTATQVVVDVTPVNDPPVLTVSTNALTLLEDFGTILIATTRTDIDSTTLTLTVSEYTTGVVTVTTTDVGIRVANIANANGQTTLTITVGDGKASVSTQVMVTVNAVNDPPTLTVSSNSISTLGGFSPITINTTASDIEDDNTSFTVMDSSTGVVRVITSTNAIVLNTIPNASGQTTLTVRVVDSSGTTVTQSITLSVIIIPSVAPALMVSTNLISVIEDFKTSVIIQTTATDVDGDTITVSVSASEPIVNAAISMPVNGQSTITNSIALTAISDANGTTTLTVLATDSGGQSHSTEIVVVVTSVEDTPTLTIPTATQRMAEDFAGVITVATASDGDDDPLLISVVESTTGIVTVTTSASGVSVSSILNANGQTTLTIAVNDGKKDTTAQVVVDVTPVNDPPTLTVTSNAVTVGSDPVVLTVSAFDLEDSTLSFSVSTGHVNTAITTTSLTITRLDFSLNAPQIMLTLRATDTGRLSTFTSIVVSPAPLLVVTTGGIKTLDFAWSAITSATHYQLQSNPDGTSGFTDFSTTGIVVSPNSTNIRQTTAQALVALHRYIPNVRNPQYSVGTCNTASSCGPSFRHNTVSLTNAQLNSLIGRLQASNAEGGDFFGAPVSLSGDGNTLAVGAWAEDGSSTGVNGAQDDNAYYLSGAVYVFRRIGGAWSQQAYIKASNTGVLDYFGFPVSLSSDGNTLAVGAFGEDGSSTGVNGAQNDSAAANSGVVYVFRRIGGAWSQQAYIKASNTGVADEFGNSVSLSADGNTLAVGARNEDSSSTGVNGVQNNNSATNSGAVYLFRFNTTSSIWFQRAYIKASNTGAFDRFGWSVSLSADGNTLAVGAYWEGSSSTGVNGAQDDNSTDTGAVYLFRFNTTSSIWSQQAYIKASNTGVADEFGNSVSLNADGNALAVGARNEESSSTGVNGAQNNNTASASGAVYLFRFSTGSSTWAQQAYIKASNTGANDSFGNSVSLSADGNTLAVGATGEDGSATGVGSVDDNSTDNAGATYVFEFVNGAWAQQAYIKATDPSFNASFGFSVSLSSNGNTLAVGASGVSDLAGAVYLY